MSSKKVWQAEDIIHATVVKCWGQTLCNHCCDGSLCPCDTPVYTIATLGNVAVPLADVVVSGDHSLATCSLCCCLFHSKLGEYSLTEAAPLFSQEDSVVPSNPCFDADWSLAQPLGCASMLPGLLQPLFLSCLYAGWRVEPARPCHGPQGNHNLLTANHECSRAACFCHLTHTSCHDSAAAEIANSWACNAASDRLLLFLVSNDKHSWDNIEQMHSTQGLAA